MNYRSVSDLNVAILNWMGSLGEFDLIVGIPRSGMLAATLMGLHLNVRVTDVDSLCAGIRTGVGMTKPPPREGSRALLLDDSVWSGETMERAHKMLLDNGVYKKYTFLTAAVYAAPGSEHLVDEYYESVPLPRVFEWNIMHYEALLARTCMDIDGVLCHDPTKDENDGDGPNYQSFLSNARKRYLPSCPVGWLVTARLERYRAETEEWLARHGVRYGELLMMNHATAEDRRAANPWPWGGYKAAIYESTGADLFIESSLELSADIARLTEKPVFCTDTREML